MKRTKKISTLLLMVVTVIASMTVASFAGTESAKKTSAIDVKAPVAPETYKDAWKGDYLYFGNNGAPLKFRVLDADSNDYGGNTILLDYNGLLKKMDFNSDGKTKEWDKSDIRKWLNGDGTDSFYNTAFAVGEKQAIVSSVKANPSKTDGPGFSDTLWTPLNGDKLFALDSRELTNPAYGYENQNGTTARSKSGNSRRETYWTRSYVTMEHEGQEPYGVATGFGVEYTFIADKTGMHTPYVSPAMNVNRNQVLLTLPAVDSTEASDSLNPENRDEISEWKLVLKDSSHEKFNAKFKSGSKGTMTVDYAEAVSGDNEYLSAVVLNKEGHIKYYGKLCKAEKASGEVQLKLPSDYNEENGDQLYIFNEECNGDKQTDYGSSLQLMEHKCDKSNMKYVDNGNDTHRQECATCGYVTIVSEKHEADAKSTCVKKSNCKKCDAELDDINPNNHENLQKVEAKEPTETEEGNIEYYYCDACGKYYKDAEAKDEIQQKDTILEKVTKSEEPNKDDVNGNDDNKGNDDGNVAKDDHKKTTVSKANGVHKNETKSQKENTVSNSPKTGDESNVLFFGICLAVSVLALAGIRVKMSRRNE